MCQYLNDLKVLEDTLKPYSKGVLQPDVEAKIKSNVFTITRKMYQNFQSKVEQDQMIPHMEEIFQSYSDSEQRLNRSYQKMLSLMEKDWTMAFSQARIHEKDEEVEKSLVQLSTLYLVQSVFNKSLSQV